MAHILLLDVPGGNDFTVLEDAVQAGHEVTFYTSDLDHYRRQGEVTEAALALARDIVEIRPFDYAAFELSATLNLTPLVTAGWAFLFLGESVGIIQIVGMVAVILGVLVVQMGKKSSYN